MEAGAITVEDLLNFNFDEGFEHKNKENTQFSPSLDFHQGLALPEFAEEDLEWLSNKEAFPSLDSCLDILSEAPAPGHNHRSPVSVLDTISISNVTNITNGCLRPRPTVPLRYPMKPRSTATRQRKRLSRFPDPPTRHFVLWGQENARKKQQQQVSVLDRKCTHCQVDKTPQWRAGPEGPKTLCNACGVRYKSGRLVPEYRPANSPTFSSVLHSNSHRKVVEMRRQKQFGVA